MTKNRDSDPLVAIHNELNKVQDNPRSLVVITNAFLELLTSIIVKRHLKNAKVILEDTRTFSYYVIIVTLNEKRLIDDSIFKLLNRFRRIRNRASHDALFKIQKEEIEYLNSHFRHMPPIQGLVHTCQRIIGTVWNLFPGLFMEELVE